MTKPSTYTKLVEYRVRPECLQDNLALVRALCDALARRAPPDVRYRVWQRDTALDFVHLAVVEAPGAQRGLHALPEFTEWTRGLADRCDEAPRFTLLSLLGEAAPPDHWS